jgi:hypothetical protein
VRTVNLEFPPRSAHRAHYILGCVLVFALVLVVAGVVFGSREAARARQQATLAADMLAQQADLTDAALQKQKVSVDVVDAVNSAIRRLDYPVVELLRTLEGHVQSDVTLVSIEMGAAQSNLRLVVQADSVLPVLNYIDVMKGEPGFRRIALTRQESSSNGNDQSSWRFTLEVSQVNGIPTRTEER